jgi:hypothetical protein
MTAQVAAQSETAAVAAMLHQSTSPPEPREALRDGKRQSHAEAEHHGTSARGMPRVWVPFRP